MARRFRSALPGLVLGLVACPALAGAAPTSAAASATGPADRVFPGLLLAGLGCVVALVAWRFLSPASPARPIALGCAPALLLLGGYLLANANRAPTAGVAPPTPVALANPVAADAASRERGRALFAANCTSCHGAGGRGDGPLAPTLNPRPANLGDAHMSAHRDPDLYLYISNGIPGSAMAAWSDRLAERDRWDLVNFVRTLAPAAGGATGATPAVAVGTRPPARLSGSPVPPGLAGRLYFGADGRLWTLDPGDGAPVDLTPKRSRDTLAAEPALSPDGATIAFTLVALPALGQGGGTSATPGSDIYLLDLRSGEQRRVLEHARPATLIESLNWTPDGRALIYASSVPLLAADGTLTGIAHEVQRLDLATGQRATLIEDGRSPALSPDGALLAYVAVDPRTFETTLWLANADGGGRRQLVGAQGGFADFLSPRFSPDGARIAFSVAGGPGVEPPPPSPSANGAPERLWRWLIAPIAPPGAAAHGLPGDIWLVARDGGEVQRLTALYEDQPVPAWSPDGRWIAVLGGSGLYVVRADGGDLVRRSKVGGSGSLVWAPGGSAP